MKNLTSPKKGQKWGVFCERLGEKGRGDGGTGRGGRRLGDEGSSRDLLKGWVVMIGCRKFENGQEYIDKYADIIKLRV